MSAATLAAFTHRWLPGDAGAASPTLLLLHGTGGDESDLLDLAAAVAPGASRLGVRGRVLEQGMPRFFRRLAEGVFDERDLVLRTRELAEFVREAARHYGFASDRLHALGFSNGANIAAALLLLEPGVLRGAVLLRAMMPIEPERAPVLAGTDALISAGRLDPITPAARVERLASYLGEHGADVTLRWQQAGHGLVRGDIDDASAWLRSRLALARGHAERGRR